MERLILIDGNAILHRAYHALPPLTNRNGELVNAVYGFSSMLLRILDELKPKYIIVSFDTGKVSFRNEEFVGYKANRPKMDEELAGQIEKVYKVVEAFNIPIYTADGYEADDVIATLALQASKCKVQNSKCKVDEVLIVTGDKDLMQLVNGKVKLYMPTKGLSEAQIVGEKEVEEKMGINPNKIVDFKGLVGDPSDNYPGVPGIGPKTAIKLLEKYGTVEEIYRQIGEGDKGFEGFGESIIMKLKEGKESAFLSKKLATVLKDVPVDLDFKKAEAEDFDKEKITALFRELGFRSLIGRLGGKDEKGNMGDPTSSIAGLPTSLKLRGTSRGARKGKIGTLDERQQSLF